MPLAALNPDDVLQDTPAIVVAAALGLVLSGPDSATIQVRNYLREKALLLVFDNFEHLVAEAIRLHDLLHAAPSVKILVTSRERLNIHGEWLVELAGLSFPDDAREREGEGVNRPDHIAPSLTRPVSPSVDELEQYDAIRLSVQRALGDSSAAFARYTESLALFRKIGNQWGMASSLLKAGRLALAHRADLAAARLLHEALRLALDTSSAPQIAAIMAAYEPLVARAGDPAWAAELAQLAAAPSSLDHYHPHIARLLEGGWPLGARAAAMPIEDALEMIGAATRAPAPEVPPTSPPSSQAGLTAREVEVLGLVAQGLSDAKVAERLVLSRRTVHAHLASIYHKLGVKSRGDAVRTAAARGLI